MDLNGKIALITGATTGIGFEYCRELLRNGVQKLCIADINQKSGEAAVNKITDEFGKNRVLFIKTDVTKKSEMEVAFKVAMSAWKRLDIVINNAGIMNDLDWELQIAVNIHGVIYGSQFAYNFMSKSNGGTGGTLVNIASILGMQEMASIPVYVATKHAVLGYSRSLGMPFNYDKSGIRVLTMCPGVTITSLITEAHTLATCKDNASEVRNELDCLPSQRSENVAKGMIHLIKHGESGSVWVCEGEEPIYEIAIPNRLTLKKN